MTQDARTREIERLICRLVEGATGEPAREINTDAPLAELGMSSQEMVVLAGELEEALAIELPPTLAWEYPTIGRLAAHLAAASGRPTG